MTLEKLTDLGTAALTCIGSAPSGLPAPLVYVLLSRNGNTYTIINDEFAPVLQALKANQDTEIRTILAMWKDGGLDLPSYAFRTALRRLNPANNATELCLGDISKPLSSTMKHPKFDMLALKEYPELLEDMVHWFHPKWGIPEEAYRESMEDCLNTDGPVPRWYAVMDGDSMIAGIGVIENDFHMRKDLTPNVCAVYVDEPYRCQGIAGWMLTRVCNEYQCMGIDTLYLSTDHTSFYERYGWEFFCLAQEEGGNEMTRMYRKITK